MNQLSILSNTQGPGKSFEDMLDCASRPDNILIDVIPDNTLRDFCDLKLNDGVVIDRGLTQPHPGGDYYLIEQDNLKSIRQIMTLPNQMFHVANDHYHDILSKSEFHIIGKVLGSVKVRMIN